jgi:hypothetical protein
MCDHLCGMHLLTSVLAVAALLAAAVPAHAQSEETSGEELSLNAFVGDWGRHGVQLTISDDGTAWARWRVYEWCGPGVRPPCDRIENDYLISGGQADLVFAPQAPDSVQGEVLTSTDPQSYDVGPVTLRLVPYGMAVLEQGGQETVLCGPRFLDEAPADVRDTYPCGA